MATTTPSRNARIATAAACALVAILAASPSAAADDPEIQEDGTIADGPCIIVDPYGPGFSISLPDCVPPSP